MKRAAKRDVPPPRPGIGVDRSTIRRMLALTPSERLRLATEEARNLERLDLRRIK